MNGHVVATGLTFRLKGSNKEQYSLVVPERSLHAGRNRVELLLASAGELTPLAAR